MVTIKIFKKKTKERIKDQEIIFGSGMDKVKFKIRGKKTIKTSLTVTQRPNIFFNAQI